MAGMVTLIVTALRSDAALRSLAPQWCMAGGGVESAPVLLLMIAYTLIFSALGGYALVAQRQEIQHAFAHGTR